MSYDEKRANIKTQTGKEQDGKLPHEQTLPENHIRGEMNGKRSAPSQKACCSSLHFHPRRSCRVKITCCQAKVSEVKPQSRNTMFSLKYNSTIHYTSMIRCDR
jgi:hypothetical protein